MEWLLFTVVAAAAAIFIALPRVADRGVTEAAGAVAGKTAVRLPN